MKKGKRVCLLWNTVFDDMVYILTYHLYSQVLGSTTGKKSRQYSTFSRIMGYDAKSEFFSETYLLHFRAQSALVHAGHCYADEGEKARGIGPTLQ